MKMGLETVWLTKGQKSIYHFKLTIPTTDVSVICVMSKFLYNELFFEKVGNVDVSFS